ncbi:T9SS type A sorting domain-containing protein [Lewinella cohaerens]|uniref:T9SS type A sorting domain-containing protein n=1 Tax=Lewinella cohaerens TaxID=70995 RepID=UPI00035F7406|nr:T9SS type A sorting domain-containing protein [Lewinella cohaerens]
MKKPDYQMKTHNNTLSPFFLQLSRSFAVILCLLATTLHAQSWLHNYPGVGSGFDIVEAANGDLLTIAHQGADNEIVLTRIDPEASVVWQFSIAPNTSNWGPSLIRTDDNHYVAAYVGLVTVDGQQNSAVVLRKFDEEGNTIWETAYPNPDLEYNSIRSLVEASDNGFILSGHNSDYSASYVMKLDDNGVQEWFQEYPGLYTTRVIEASNGDLIYCGSILENGSRDVYLYRMDSFGELIWQRIYGYEGEYDYAASVIETNDNGIALLKAVSLSPNHEVELLKTDMNGELIWATQWTPQTANAEGSSKLLYQNTDGVFEILTLHGFSIASSPITKLDEDGTILNLATDALYMSPYYNAFAFTPCEAGGYAIVGSEWISGMGAELIVSKTNNDGEILHGLIQGNVFHDQNSSCSWDTGENGLSNWVITALNNATQHTYTTTTDSLGDYQLALFNGTYDVMVSPPVPIWQTCPGQTIQTVTITTQDTPPEIEEVDFPIVAIYECPVLTVDISTPFLRRCFNNTYYVEYCNIGTDNATDAYIEVVLDDFMTVLSASIPYENQMDSILIFPVGDIGIGECGQFSITTHLDCETTILGQTHCTEAHIYPDDYCLPVDVNWDMSSITLDGACESDSVRFEIKNEGVGNMAAPLNYIIVVDEVIMLQGDFQLDSGETQEVAILANGETYRIESEQSPGHPESIEISFTLDGCPDFGVAGFVNWFELNDFYSFQDIDCQQNIGAYDPNDKIAYPRGYGNTHQIKPGTELEYLIRFQNTGTDTAFRIVVRDELSADLDVSSLRMGVASHAYEWEIVNSNTLKVIFDDIMLPDSNINEVASHGFFKFSISPKEATELGTVIENKAGIYFDFNEPIVTNTVFHTIDSNFVLIELISFDQEVDTQMPIQVFPNPIKTSANFVLTEQKYASLNLDVYDSSGRLIQQFAGSGGSLTMPVNGLRKGIYVYRLYGDHSLLGTGKLIVID